MRIPKYMISLQYQTRIQLTLIQTLRVVKTCFLQIWELEEALASKFSINSEFTQNYNTTSGHSDGHLVRVILLQKPGLYLSPSRLHRQIHFYILLTFPCSFGDK